MSLWDHAGFGESYSGEGCFVCRYVDGVVAETLGPYDTERKSTNARNRWRRNALTPKDRKLLADGDMAARFALMRDAAAPRKEEQ